MKPEDQKAFEQAFKEFLKNYRMGGNPLKDCAEGLFKAAIAHRDAQPALSHVNETPKNKHDSGDVLKKAGNLDMMREALRQNVRAFRHSESGEIKYVLGSVDDESHYASVMIIPNLPNYILDQALAAHAIQDAMQEKNK